MSPPLTSPEPPAVAEQPCVAPLTDPVQWFKEEVHPHDGQLKSWLRGRYPSVRDVDDVVQESYLRIWKARSAHKIASAKAFLFRIAKHLAIDHVRRDSASPVDEGSVLEELSVLDTAPHAADALVAQDTFRLLTEAIAALPTRAREVFILHKLRGVSHREIAAQLGLSERSVEKYSGISLKKCEDYLRAHGIEDSLG